MASHFLPDECVLRLVARTGHLLAPEPTGPA